MDAGEIEVLTQEVDALVADLDEERFRHVAGIEPEPALASLFAARPRAAHRNTVAALREAGQAALADRVAALRAERAQAEDEEAWRAAEAKAEAAGPAGTAPLSALERGALSDPDPERRRAWATAAGEALAPALALREKAAEARARARAEVGLAPDWRIVVEGDQLLAASDDAWRDVLAFVARREGAPGPGRGLDRGGLVHLLRPRRWDGLFKAGMLPVALRITCEKLGLRADLVRVDSTERAARWGGAHAVGARVSFAPLGGAGDWQDLLGAFGRALAAAHARPSVRDAASGHALGAALAALLEEPRFLAERADVERRHARDVVRDLALRRLFALRARAAALRIATEVERGLSGAAWREGYREAMTAALGATWEAARAARDADAPAHAAALAGAGLGEALRRDLRERFDEDWWRNPRSGPHLAGLLAAGTVAYEGASPVEAAGALAAAVGA
jgi:hypothetical protein